MSEKVTNLIEEVKALTVLELSELVKALEEEFGVSAAAPAAVAVAAPAPVPVTPQPPVTGPVVPPPPAVPAAPPAPAVPVAGAPAYTLDQLAKAGAALVDAGKMESLMALLAKYGVQAVTQLPPAQYGAFATELRALGAQI